MNKLQELKDWCLDWLWPRFCLGCGREGGWLCRICFRSDMVPIMTQTCPGCGQREGYFMCQKCQGKWSLDGLIVCLQKSLLIKKIIHHFKYSGLYDLAYLITLNYLKPIVYDQFDAVDCVPLTNRKKRMRGFNQTELIANLLAARIGIKPVFNLRRIKNFQSQVGLDRIQRLQNVVDNFGLVKKVISNRVLLVDDVCTTMATLNECSRVLKQGGVKEVVGIVLARGL